MIMIAFMAQFSFYILREASRQSKYRFHTTPREDRVSRISSNAKNVEFDKHQVFQVNYYQFVQNCTN